MQTQRYEIEAFLGDDFTTEQIDQIADEYYAWERDLGADADQDESTAILSAIAPRAAGVLYTAAAGPHDRAAQIAAMNTRRELKAATVVLTRARVLSESEAERRAGVTRMTVRSWLGK
jgi:hypothetical protein